MQWRLNAEDVPATPRAEAGSLSDRRFPIGAEVRDGSVDFRVWAPLAGEVEAVFDDSGKGDCLQLVSEGNGYFRGSARVPVGTHYWFRLDRRDGLLPDPASRYQPLGPDGPSVVVDPNVFVWEDATWQGIGALGQVIYEIHLGCFTREGTWKAAERELPELRRLGVTVVELMPLAEFPGRFGWGYDGVCFFAPYHGYGAPDDFRSFVNTAHRVGLGVILDVVYNHVGPEGNHLKDFSPGYCTERYKNEWGAAINFDGPDSGPVREFFVTNACHWIEEYHVDGFRFDATQQIFDASETHILAELVRTTRERYGKRKLFFVGENEPQDARLMRALQQGGYGLDALWNDDFHHSAMASLTGRNEAYYTDHLGTPQEFISALKWGFLFQGQRYKWQKQPRGTPALDLPPEAFVNFIQNHDQIANSARGERVHILSRVGNYRAMTALLLLAPATPMLFMGQEFAASSPFCYFADLGPSLAGAVQEGRREFLRQFPSLATAEAQRLFPVAHDPGTFEASKLDFSERETHREIYEMHRDLLRLRQTDSRFRLQVKGGVDGAVLGPEAFVIRFLAADSMDERLLLVNFGRDLHLSPAPEPLLAQPSHGTWAVLWSSEDPAYGGQGTPPLEGEEGWLVPGAAAVVLRPVRSLLR